jgi:hypothetical protein
VISQLRALLRSPEIVVRTWRAANRGEDGPPVSEREVVDALQSLEPVWDELFPGEQARILRLLVESVTVASDGLEIRLRAEGLSSLVEELRERAEEEPRSAARAKKSPSTDAPSRSACR